MKINEKTAGKKLRRECLRKFRRGEDYLEWKDCKSWIEYGLKERYVGRSVSSFRFSEDVLEKSWYHKGANNRWLNRFDFEKSRNSWTEKEWKKYGLENRLFGKAPSELSHARDRNHRSWYHIGVKREWALNLQPKTNKGKFRNKKEWLDYGVERGYNHKERNALRKSEEVDERSWYAKGDYEKWTGAFRFKKVRTYWKGNFKEWKTFGLEKKYDNVNVSKLESSSDKEERSWYVKGYTKGWTKRFPFKKIRRDQGYWKEEENVFNEALNAMKNLRLEDLPSGRILSENGYSSITRAINVSHSGFPAFRRALNNYLGRPSEDQTGSLLERYVGGTTQ